MTSDVEVPVEELNTQQMKPNVDYGWPLIVSLSCAMGLLTSLAVLTSVIPISGSVVAEGAVEIRGNAKALQHAQGGTIRDVLIQEGQSVKVGQTLLRLDASAFHANKKVYHRRLVGSVVRRDRLLAERDNLAQFTPHAAAAEFAGSTDYATAVAAEKLLFDTRRKSFFAQIGINEKKVSQIKAQVQGLLAAQRAKSTQLKLLEKEHAGLVKLRVGGNTTVYRLHRVQQQIAAATGDHEQLRARIIQSQIANQQTLSELAQLRAQRAEQIVGSLQLLDKEVHELRQQLAMVQHNIALSTITAPVNGTIHQLSPLTVGGVLSPHVQIMQIVPIDHPLEFVAEVAPKDIVNLKVGQHAKIQLNKVGPRAETGLAGRIHAISPTTEVDALRRGKVFKVRIVVPAEERKLKQLGQVWPGMPFTAFLPTDNQPIMTYLLAPLVGQFDRTFRAS